MKLGKIIAIMTFITLPSEMMAQTQPATAINWTIAAKLPPARPSEEQLGLAGVFTGISHNRLLVAGGSYFPEKMPWEGGKKVYTNQVFVLERTRTGSFLWVPAKFTLKSPTAYGASATIADGLVCAGGETETANSSRDAYILKWDAAGRKVISQSLPLLPIPLANACMTAIGKKIYIMGGESNGIPSSKVFMLDLTAKHSVWAPLPDMPLAMSHSVAVTQSDGDDECIYVIGGRSSTPAGISQLHSAAYCFNPLTHQWNALSNIRDAKQVTNLSAASGVPIGKNQILIISGDKGDVFHQIETLNSRIATETDPAVKEQLQAKKLRLVTQHAGFSRDLLLYNTYKNTWTAVGELPFAGHVTTTALKWNNEIFIPAGEVRPGTRTPDILKGEILHEFK